MRLVLVSLAHLHALALYALAGWLLLSLVPPPAQTASADLQALVEQSRQTLAACRDKVKAAEDLARQWNATPPNRSRVCDSESIAWLEAGSILHSVENPPATPLLPLPSLYIAAATLVALALALQLLATLLHTHRARVTLLSDTPAQ